MSKLAEYRQLEQQLAAKLAELEAMKNDDSLKKEIEFETKLRALMAEYSISLGGIINILDPQAGRRAPAASSSVQRKTRALKIYINPQNGERVETKGGNHKTLKAWKGQYGGDVVESWLQK
ncbi:MAG: histone-like nucleoid-structuring protein, MvaT/MvaU family [Pseudomonas sp.]|nr:histone-like nucleoid-structuring protein, MvaT/MvaU family [Pseudomonas sp.]